MRCHRLLMSILLALTLTSLSAWARAEPAPGSTRAADPTLSTLVDGVLGSQQREHKLAGITVAVVRDNALQFAKGYGLADLASARAVDPASTLFRIGSVSKTFTWTAAMLLVERGELDLDTDVNRYLRDVQVAGAFDEPVTMRHLMSHRAGFEDSMQLFTVADDDTRSLAELLETHQPRRVHPPGARTSYSNWGAALAAQVLEDIAGTSYGEFIQQELLTPLGMDNTTWQPPHQLVEAADVRLATGYKPKKGGLGLQGYLQLGAYWPAGGMASTAVDMARWMRFHLNGGEIDGTRLMRSETHAQMWRRAYDARPDAADVAHGWQDVPYRGLRTLGHGGGTAAFLTNMVLVPELGLGVFISQNSAHTFVPVAQLPLLIVDYLQASDPVPMLVDDEDADALGELAGTYMNNRRVFSTFAAVLGTVSVAQLVPTSPEGFELSNPMEGSEHYRRLQGAADVFENARGGRVAVLRNDSGDVEALADPMGIHTLERIGIWKNPNTLAALLGIATLLALTTLLGAWRRFGRGGGWGFSSSVPGGISIAAGAVQLLFIAILGVLIMGLADFDLSRMADDYPDTRMFLLHYAGWMVTGVSLAMLAGLWPTWSGSGWSLWRRLHFSLFALALVLVSAQLWQWRIIGAPVI